MGFHSRLLPICNVQMTDKVPLEHFYGVQGCEKKGEEVYLVVYSV